MLPSDTAPDCSCGIGPRWKDERVSWEGDRGCVLDAGREARR